MVAVIKTGHSIHRILNYNENKVKEGVAKIISAANYPIDVEKLSFTQKLNRLLKQVALNENVTRKAFIFHSILILQNRFQKSICRRSPTPICSRLALVNSLI